MTMGTNYRAKGWQSAAGEGAKGWQGEAPEPPSWERWYYKSESEQMTMMADFNAWVIKKRLKVETEVLNCEREMVTCEPFARAGLAAAKTPADLPYVFIEFAESALRLLEEQRKMKLLNDFYKANSNWQGQEYLKVNPGDEAEINALWEMFMEDRAKGEVKA